MELSTRVKWGIYSIGHISNISIRFSKVSLLKLPYLSGLVYYLTIHYFNTQFYDKEKTSKRVFGLESWALYQKWCDSCRQLPANTAYLRLSLSWKLSSLMLTSFTTTGAKRKKEKWLSLYISKKLHIKILNFMNCPYLKNLYIFVYHSML